MSDVGLIVMGMAFIFAVGLIGGYALGRWL